MDRTKGRRTAIVAAVLAAVVVVAGIIAGRDLILERWWIYRLGSEDEATWKAAAERLGGLKSRRAIAALVEKYGKVTEEDQGLIKTFLYENGAPAVAEAFAVHGDVFAPTYSEFNEAKVAVLRECLGDPRPKVRFCAIQVLIFKAVEESLRKVPAPVIRRVLLEGLLSGSPEVRRSALRCLHEVEGYGMRFAVPAVCMTLEDPDPEVRAEAAQILERLSDPRSIPALLKVLRDPDSRVRADGRDALRAVFGNGGTRWRSMLWALAAVMGDPEGVQVGMEVILSLAGTTVRAAGQALAISVEGDGFELTCEACSRISSFGPHTDEAFPALLAIIDGPRAGPLDHLASALVLAVNAPEDRRSLGAVRKVIELDELGGWLHEKFVEALRPIARHQPEAVPILIRFLEEEGWTMGPRVARALGDVGPAARSALPALEKALADERPDLRIAAAEAIWRIAGEAKKGLPILIQVLRSGEDSEIRAAIDLVGAIGPGAARAVPALVELLDKRRLCEAAADALARIGLAAVPALAAALGGEKDWTRYGAARALAALGAAARGALPALEKALGDDDDDVRALAGQAIAAIRG